MGKVLTTVKCKLIKRSSIFSILVVISFPIFADPSPYTYDLLLDQAVVKMKAFDYGRALDRLEIASTKNPTPDYRYYYILGETYFRMGKMLEAIQAFDKSLEEQPGQIELLLRLATFQESDRRPERALNYLKEIIRFTPDNKEIIYRAGILALRSGEPEYADRVFTQLEQDSTYDIERDAILDEIQKKIQSKEWKESIQLCRKYLLYFPRKEILHEYLILALRGEDSPDLEKAIVDSTAISYRNANFAVRYGIFLQEKERMLEALSAFRRGYTISLLNQDKSSREEILFLIRQTYSFLKREHDARAMSTLQKISLEKSENLEEEIQQSIRTYPKNREILVYAIWHYTQKNDAESLRNAEALLKERDRENEEKELIYVVGPFSRENLLQSMYD